MRILIANIGFVFLVIGYSNIIESNSDWPFTTQSKVLKAHWLVPESK